MNLELKPIGQNITVELSLGAFRFRLNNLGLSFWNTELKLYIGLDESNELDANFNLSLSSVELV